MNRIVISIVLCMTGMLGAAADSHGENYPPCGPNTPTAFGGNIVLCTCSNGTISTFMGLWGCASGLGNCSPGAPVTSADGTLYQVFKEVPMILCDQIFPNGQNADLPCCEGSQCVHVVASTGQCIKVTPGQPITIPCGNWCSTTAGSYVCAAGLKCQVTSWNGDGTPHVQECLTPISEHNDISQECWAFNQGLPYGNASQQAQQQQAPQQQAQQPSSTSGGGGTTSAASQQTTQQQAQQQQRRLTRGGGGAGSGSSGNTNTQAAENALALCLEQSTTLQEREQCRDLSPEN